MMELTPVRTEQSWRLVDYTKGHKEKVMEGLINSHTIPAWAVALIMITTGLMWLISREDKVRMDSRLFAITFILEGIIYGIIYQFFNVSVELRGFFTRVMLIVLSMSQFAPLAISYMRSLQRDTKRNSGTNNNNHYSD